DVVACYAHYLRTGDDEALLGVVEHNAADVLSMVALMGIYGEPLGQVQATLDGSDFAGAARTLFRAGALDRARRFADEAVERGGGAIARRTRGDIAKAAGDKAKALADYEAALLEVDDAALRLELAKLYEHHLRAYESALAMVGGGTGESDERAKKRR